MHAALLNLMRKILISSMTIELTISGAINLLAVAMK